MGSVWMGWCRGCQGARQQMSTVAVLPGLLLPAGHAGDIPVTSLSHPRGTDTAAARRGGASAAPHLPSPLHHEPALKHWNETLASSSDLLDN